VRGKLSQNKNLKNMNMAKPKVIIETYGCQMNVADSELIQGILHEAGMEAATSLQEADVILLNTCAIREKAEARILGRLTNMLPYKRRKPSLKIGVVGCMAKHLGDEIIRRAPYVNFVVGPDNYRRLPEIIQETTTDSQVLTNFIRDEFYDGITPRRPRGLCAWITIQRGCNYVCSYCIVPFVRGAERNIPAHEIIHEAKTLAEQGFSVITLLGQTVNSYRYEDWDFCKLLKAIAAIDAIEQIRFTSPHPLGFSDELIELIATEKKLAKFVHLPLQSASDAVLERMRRGYSFAQFKEIVQKLRALQADIAVSTDIIVGFSGESEEDYELTKKALIDLRFEFAFLFAYSERSLSIAARKFPDDVLPEVKQRRLAEIIQIQQNISKEAFNRWVGRAVPVLIEGFSTRDKNMAIGNTREFKTTIFPRENYNVGDWVEVQIEAATSLTLTGRATKRLKAAKFALEAEEAIDLGISLGPSPNDDEPEED
jgi:tRNA-2-methylthio-N6-dimethylallyladenosine synthase